MSTMSPPPVIDVSYPDPWFQLPLEPAADLASWAKEQAIQLVERAGEVAAHHRPFVSIDQDSLTRQLIDHATTARGNEPHFAFVCYPPGIGSSDIYLEISTIHPGETTTVLTLDWFEKHFSQTAVGDAQIDRMTVPAGEAVRIQRTQATSTPTVTGGQQAIYSTSYAVDSPHTDHLVVAMATWSMPGLADVITEATDGIFTTLHIAPPD